MGKRVGAIAAAAPRPVERVVSYSVLIFLLVIVLALTLTLSPAGQLCVLVWIVALAFEIRMDRLGTRTPFSRVFGLLIPLLPLVDSRALIPIGFALVYRHRGRIYLPFVRPFLPYLGVLLSAVIADLWFSCGSEYWRILLHSQSEPSSAFPWLNAISQWAHLPLPRYALGIEVWIKVMLFVLVGSICCSPSDDPREPMLKVHIVRWLSFGTLIAITFLFVQRLGFLPFVPPSQTKFWSELSRIGGTFSDPNAAGVFLILVIPILFYRVADKNSSPVRRLVGALAVALAATFTGSRTFFLGGCVYGAMWLLARNSARRIIVAVAALVVFFAAALLLFRSSPELYHTLLHLSPVGVSRTLESVFSGGESNSFYSRLVFWRTGFSLWGDAPWFGIGVGAFREAFPDRARTLGYLLGNWSDNANNFYLGVLAETGVIGFLSLIVPLKLGFRFRQARPASVAVVVCLIVLLILGPHLDFPEVALLAAIVCADAIEPKYSGQVRHVRGVACVGIVIVCAQFWLASHRQFGLYPPEFNERYESWWSMPNAQLVRVCPPDGSLEILVRNARPKAASAPVIVEFKLPLSKGVATAIELTSSRAETVSATCEPGTLAVIPFSVSPPFVPKNVGGADPRVLGVQILEIVPKSQP